MTDLLLILLGEPVVRRKWLWLMIFGILWLALGLFFALNALSDDVRIPTSLFVIPLMLDAVVTLIAAFGNTGNGRLMRFAKCGLCVTVSVLLIVKPGGSDIAIGFIVGLALILDACWRVVVAWLVRFARWRRTLFFSGVEFLFGLWAFVPWPTGWQGEVGMDVGTLIALTGANLIDLSLRLRGLSSGTLIAQVLSEGWPGEPEPHESDACDGVPARGSLTVHVWTPTGTLVPLTRGLERYIAATDENGIVSTGHASLEACPDLYISHYPAQEIDATASDFTKALRATRENDQPGRWLPSYAVESAEWRPSTFQIVFDDINLHALHRFWASYRQVSTYNLTNRNCSCAVAKALDVAIEGAFASIGRSPGRIFRLILQPELWAAGWMRYRARAMTWTPGLALDYARALSAVLQLRSGGRASREP